MTYVPNIVSRFPNPASSPGSAGQSPGQSSVITPDARGGCPGSLKQVKG